MIIGIDNGISTTKIVGIEDEKIVTAKIISKKEIERELGSMPEKPDKIIFTGINSPESEKKIDEIKAIGKGALFLAGKKKAIVISIGTGTCIVLAEGDHHKHMGGMSLGGGTLKGLSNLLINETDVEKILSLAEKGNIEKVDLLVKDFDQGKIGLLEETSSVSHFGKMADMTADDKALGLVNMIGQAIATMSVFAAASVNTQDIVFVGRTAGIKMLQDIIRSRSGLLSDHNLIFPENCEFAAALGAALCGCED